jgi:hypothetical protein
MRRHTGASLDMQFSHLAKMEAVDRECDRQGEQAWTMEKRPEKETPILNAFDASGS